MRKKFEIEYKNNREFEWYSKHMRHSHMFIIIFNLILWFFIFRYFGGKTVTVIIAIIFGSIGVNQVLFSRNLENNVFKPINKLKSAVDEISRGNYGVNIKVNSTKEINSLLNSFNEMAEKLYEGEKLKKAYEENRKLLIANISHDLKTPITSIQGYIETMLEMRDLPQDKINKYYKIIYNNSVYMNKLIEDLFLFSKLDMQKLELNFEKVDVKNFMNDLMEEFKYDMEDRGIKFNYVDELKKDCYINIDCKRVNQIFRNIIGNAVKYSCNNVIKIEVRLYEMKDYLCASIKDNGPGIPGDKLQNIFNRFYKVDYARTKDLMSTGLGLAIAKELMESHGGRIEVSSTQELEPALLLCSQGRWRIRMKKILIIEDDINIAEMERDYLELNGYSVEIVQDGNKGIDMIMGEMYDVIIVDLMLPGKNGFEIIKEVRKKFEIPVIVVSARNEDIDKIRGLNFGADDYMTKPFSPAELAARIKSHISRYERLKGNNFSSEIIVVKGLEINRASHRVTVNGKEVKLTSKEYEILVFLASNPNIVFTKGNIFDSIWGSEFIGDLATVAVHIQKIRKKIEKDPQNPEFIETLWGTGYRFKL